MDILDLLEEPFLALPAASRPLRDFWLAVESRQGHAPLIGGEVASTEEVVEAMAAELGVCLVATGNAPLVTREGITTRPVTGVTPCELLLAWRADDRRPLVGSLIDAVRRSVGTARRSVDAIPFPADPVVRSADAVVPPPG